MGRGRSPACSTIGASAFHRHFDDKVAAVHASTSDAPNDFRSVSVDDIVTAVRQLPDKQCASDPMPTRLLKENIDVLAPFLTEFFNRSLSLGAVPVTFKAAYISLLLKKTHLDPADAKSFRPISNLSVLSKLLERIVAQQLLGYLRGHRLLPDLQSAYRAHHSTETAVLKYCLTFLVLSTPAICRCWHCWTCRRLLIQSTIRFFCANCRHHTALASSSMRGSGPTSRTIRNMYADGNPPRHHCLCCSGCHRDRSSGWSSFCSTQQTWCVWLSPSDWNHSLRWRHTDLRFMPTRCYSQPAESCCWLHRRCRWLDAVQPTPAEHRQDRVSVVYVGPPSAPTANWPARCWRRLACASQRRAWSRHLRRLRPVNADTRPENIRKVFRRLAPEPQHLTVSDAASTRVTCCGASLSRLDYGCATLAGVPSQLLDRLQSAQNAAAWLIFGASRHVHITPLLRSLHWLSVRERIAFRPALLVYRCLHGMAPAYLSADLLRVSDVGPRQRLRSAMTSALVTLNAPRSAIVPLLLLHWLSGTVYQGTCGRQHHCQCSGIGWRPSSTDAHSAPDTLCDWHMFL